MQRRHVKVISVVAVLVAAFAVAGLTGGPAGAHNHPTQVELDAPAVAFIKTFAQVNVSLVEHNRHGKHIGLLQRTYEPELASGSGFAVDPNGTIVTAGAVVTPDLARAEVFAVNKVFAERYGRHAPMPPDPFDKHTIKDLPDDPLNQRLQRCYRPNTTDNTGGCLLSVSRLVRVYPWVSDQNKYGALLAEVLSPDPGKTQDVAVLRVGASSMPTVALGQSASATKAFTVLGFGDVPTAKSASEVQLIGHFKAPGGPPFDKDEYLPKLEAGLRAGARGGPLVSADTGQVSGLLSVPADTTGAAPSAAQARFVDVRRVREVLGSVGVQPRRGPTDAVFEDAMHSFKNKLYTPPIPSFQRTLELYPGHALATEFLAVSKAKAGSAEDLTGKEGGGAAGGSRATGTGWVPFVLAGLVVLVLLAAAALLLLLRRRRGEGAEPAEEAPAVTSRPATAGVATGAGRTGPPPLAAAAAAPSSPPPSADGSVATPRRGGTAPMPGAGAGPSGQAAAPGTPRPAAGRAATGGQRVGQVGAPVAPPTPGAWPPEEAPTFCTQCGHRLGAGHRFCGFCGTPVGWP